MKHIILSFGLCCFILSVYAGKLTHISAEITGYTEKQIAFGFVEEPALSLNFPYVENQTIEFDVTLPDITMMKINGWICVCLQPGDSIHAKVIYEGKVYRTVEYTGSPTAVAAATLLHQIRELRNGKKYRQSVPSALVSRVPVREYFQATLKEWEEEMALLEKIREELPENLYNYLKSEIEGVLLSNLLIYPFAYMDNQKKDVQENLPEKYWEVMEHYFLREDEGSLRNRQYITFLTPYKAYMKSKKAGILAVDYAPAKDMTEEFRDIAAFYEGPLRDAALFAFLYKAIVEVKELESVKKLKKEYQRKYNLNKTYKTTLDELLK